MTVANRRLHDRALELAATSVDVVLGRAEAAELEAHLAACPTCARSARALRIDAAALRLPAAILPSRRVDHAVAVAIAGRPARPQSQVLVLVAATALLLVALLGVAAVGAFLLRSHPPVVVVPSPAVPAVVVNPSPNASPAASPPPASSPASSALPTPGPGALPVAVGSVQLAPGPDGDAYVVVNGSPAGAVVSLMAASGTPRTGWPIGLPGWSCDNPSGGTSLWSPAIAADGSVRIVCTSLEVAGGATATVRAFAFDAAGQPLAGWPVDLPEKVWEQPRIVGDRLVVAAHESSDQEPYSGAYWLVEITADGTVRTGARYEITTDAGSWPVAIGPEGIAYRVAGDEITAFDLGGVRAGWPIRIEGAASALGFGPAGRIYLTTTPTGAVTSRLLVLDRDGQAVPVGSGPLPVVGTSAWSGAGPAGGPLAPLVLGDGTAFIVGEAGGHAVVYGIDPAGSVMSGWPHHAATRLEWQGSCAADATGCGVWRSVPVVGQSGVVYLPLAAPDAQIGGSLLAIGRDGTAMHGWPIHLARRGAAFWSVAEGSDGTVYALAVEPEAGGKTSATILAIAADGTVRSRTTVVQP